MADCNTCSVICGLGVLGPALRICFSAGFMGAKVMLHIVHFAFLNSGRRWCIWPGVPVACFIKSRNLPYLLLVSARIYKERLNLHK